ncbi:MAG: Eco57I restriction-modification methylase domain-containing protein [Pseudanabaena sp. Salubria-1]|nr:Eco57I restriction-modification methylase domain-containing protein [Pseudanabaena sp. Salubria-1]
MSHIAQFFGLKQAKTFLRINGANAITDKPHKMQKLDREVYEEAQKLSKEKRFFHWDLEFPEVFIDLDTASWKEDSGFDAIVGNPPYDVLAEKERKESLKDLINYFKSNPNFRNSLGGKLDLFRMFISLSDYLICSSGSIGLIVPMSFLADQQVIKLRKSLLQSGKIYQINAFPQKDDPNRRIFKEAKLPTCIVILGTIFNSQSIKVTVHPNNLLEEISGTFSCSLDEIEALDDNNFSIPLLSSNEEVKVLKRFSRQNKMQKMRDICQTYQGEINETNMDDLISTNSNDGSRILRGGNVQRYEFIPEPRQGVEKYINLSDYNQQIGGERIVHTIQPRIGYQRNAALNNWKRLIFSPLPTPSYCFDSVSYFLIEDNIRSFALLALLNSHLLEWRFNLTSTNNHVSTSEIDALPIPVFPLTTPPDRHQQLFQNAITLYKQYQTDHQIEPLLNQVNHHINQEIEEADVIHDLLAYLAEQMIELNKQKQTEIKSFLKWLERFIGCEIDTLTNKSKIQNYLGDYYKDTPHLSFDELIEVLKKNSKKIKIDPVARKEQQSLEKEYQDSLNTLLPIKHQLVRCDKLIDAIVYRLYGLTEEEIAIVEGKQDKAIAKG